MEVVITPTPRHAAELAADAVCRLLEDDPRSVLGLATGSSPLALYRALIDRHRAGQVSFGRARAFTLDEYVGLPRGHAESYREVIRRELEDHVDFPAGAVTGPDGHAEDLARAGRDYEEAIVSAGGVDLQVLGLGGNGHIAFNEPGSSLNSLTRVKALTRRTRSDNARFFGGNAEEVPSLCLTQGLGTIRRARHLVLIATGEAKAPAVAAMVEGPVSASCPASVLQLHPHVTVLLDGPAASDLQHRDDYAAAWAVKPAGQGL
ncbi:glucosamine-6-phosphate deaminase [Kineococcus sp. GCM10028916]|uniref:glucosamine-6-phosphate deaminase n=1 Tax=Kineococcus sp. GCM10028916 TaxID=3273394 RepID=UPI00363D4B27